MMTPASRGTKDNSELAAAAPRSVTRVVQIFDDLCSRPTGASLATLSDSIGVPKSSLLNLLRGLLASNHLTFVNGLYQLGPEAYGMASAIISARNQLADRGIKWLRSYAASLS